MEKENHQESVSPGGEGVAAGLEQGLSGEGEVTRSSFFHSVLLRRNGVLLLAPLADNSIHSPLPSFRVSKWLPAATATLKDSHSQPSEGESE